MIAHKQQYSNYLYSNTHYILRLFRIYVDLPRISEYDISYEEYKRLKRRDNRHYRLSINHELNWLNTMIEAISNPLWSGALKLNKEDLDDQIRRIRMLNSWYLEAWRQKSKNLQKDRLNFLLDKLNKFQTYEKEAFTQMKLSDQLDNIIKGIYSELNEYLRCIT